MKKNLNGNNGISIKLLTEKLKTEFSKPTPKTKTKKKSKNTYESGKLKTSDWKNIHIGLKILDNLIHEGFSIQMQNLLAGNKDVSKIQKELVGFKEVMGDFLHRLLQVSRDEYELQKRMELLTDYSEIAQAARDGIVIKQEKRIELINGVETEIKYDTSMSPREVISILNEYHKQSDKLKLEKLDNYLGIGLGLAGTIGTIAKHNQNKDESSKGTTSLVTMGSTIVGGLKLLQGLIKSNDTEKLWELRNEEFRMGDDLLDNEQISNKATENSIQSIKDISQQEIKLENKIKNRGSAYNIALDLAVALLSGAYLSKNVQTKENGKIDGKSFASALIDFQGTKGLSKHFIVSAQGIVNTQKEEKEFQELCKRVQEILDQMDEKVFPLRGATHSFDSISIHDFTGNFYPKKNYRTGKINYATTIKIPEFSLKRGDVVLLSGESGTGKSTFLRFLKRGDINNTQAIQLDNGEMVDNLGNEYISFKPSTNLGNETNVLYQITGKKNISDLTEDEQKNLETMLKELKFDTSNLLEQLASKKFMEFSTGQQRRLALSKIFYRLSDGSSVIIVDEPVGNVEDSLIREQLEMIKRYAKSRNIMLILTTHRLDLAEDLATKRYNINKDGVLEELPIKNKTNDDNNIR